MAQSIKVFRGIKKSSNGRYQSLQGTYNPRVGGPYKNIHSKPKFRSKLELRLMLMLDAPEATNVISWDYESRRIPYIDKSTIVVDKNGKQTYPTRQYVIDFIITLKQDAIVKTYWVEVKSIHDIENNKHRRKTKNTVITEQIKIKNYCKWMAASKVAKNVGAQFLVITEKELDQLKKMIYGK